MIPRVPTVFGHEFAGTVAAVGAGVSRVREGDRLAAANSAPCGECRPCLARRPNLCEDLLFVNGAYGEYIALPPRLVANNVVRLRHISAARAAFAEPLACAMLGIERARLEAGQTVAVFGHGPLGCLLGMVAGALSLAAIVFVLLAFESAPGRPARLNATPLATPAHPPGATAQCRDGTWTWSEHPSAPGTCSHHGGRAN